jgi:ATP-citrate lyase beta-subunit
MPRRKISEHRAKTIISTALAIKYVGWSIKNNAISPSAIARVAGYKNYVVKVDQAVKGRFKKGLVLLDVKQADIASSLKKLEAKGFSSFLVEPYASHNNRDERFISITQHRDGLIVSCSSKGGVDIEANTESIETFSVTNDFNYKKLAEKSQISEEKLQKLVAAFVDNYFVFLEINPYVVNDDVITVLDSAVEVDDAGQHFVSTWNNDDIREANTHRVEQEEAVKELNKGSAASFSLSLINPQGAIFLLLSGGGASVVIADEVYKKGFGAQLANYGEYSGNPSLHEAQKYTSQVLELILNSDAPKKVLFIGGAVANFTDIATTFAGVINAIDEKAEALAKQNLTVYVRRGGPNQEKGLANIKKCLERHGILGGVYDPSVTLGDALDRALEGLKK